MDSPILSGGQSGPCCWGGRTEGGAGRVNCRTCGELRGFAWFTKPFEERATATDRLYASGMGGARGYDVVPAKRRRSP